MSIGHSKPHVSRARGWRHGLLGLLVALVLAMPAAASLDPTGVLGAVGWESQSAPRQDCQDDRCG